jgi:hypothetical protein
MVDETNLFNGTLDLNISAPVIPCGNLNVPADTVKGSSSNITNTI